MTTAGPGTSCVIVGAGPRGTRLARAARGHPDVRLAGVCEPSAAAAERFRAEFPDVPVFEDLSALPGTARPHFALIATPPSRHAEDAVTALELSLAALVECPMVETPEQAEAVAAAAARARLPAAMAESFCYLPAVQTIRSLIPELNQGPGGVLDVLGGEGHYLEMDTGLAPGGWRDRYHMARYITHGLGPLLYATGHRATRVVGLDPLGRVSRSQGSLMPVALVETNRGAVFYTANSGLAPRPLTRWTVVGETWCAQSDPDGTFEGPLRVFDATAPGGWRAQPVSPHEVYGDLWGLGFEPERLMLRRFAAVVNGAAADLGLELSLNISLAGVAASRSGQARGEGVDVKPVFAWEGPG